MLCVLFFAIYFVHHQKDLHIHSYSKLWKEHHGTKYYIAYNSMILVSKKFLVMCCAYMDIIYVSEEMQHGDSDGKIIYRTNKWICNIKCVVVCLCVCKSKHYIGTCPPSTYLLMMITTITWEFTANNELVEWFVGLLLTSLCWRNILSEDVKILKWAIIVSWEKVIKARNKI